jgi:hypothetical protein
VHAPAALHVGVPLAHAPHAAPLLPHTPFAVPAAHRPLAQQPPLQAVSVGPPHAVTHLPVLVSQAWFGGQSVAFVHPDASGPTVASGPASTVASSPASTAAASIPTSAATSAPTSAAGSSGESAATSGGASIPVSGTVASGADHVSGTQESYTK